MDIKFHITKIIQSGSSADDWVNFIDQLKHNKCDRDLLTQIYTVALNNIPVKGNKVYKKLLVGLANLQSETSPTLAQKTLIDANCLDIDCAVVCVYLAQFEYRHKNKNEAFRILRRGKCDGRAPKVLIKKAYLNLKEGRTNLFDGIGDPWDDSLYDVTDTSTITQPPLKTEPESPKKFGIRNPQVVRSLSKFPPKSLGMPTRAVGKTQSASSLLKDPKTKRPTEELKEKLGLIVGDGFDKICQRIEEKYRSAEDSTVFIESRSVSDKENKENLPKKVYGPSLSPFMVNASPLVNRKQPAFFEKRTNGLKWDLFDYFENEISMPKSDFAEECFGTTSTNNSASFNDREQMVNSEITMVDKSEKPKEVLETNNDCNLNTKNLSKLNDTHNLENSHQNIKSGLTDLLIGLSVENQVLQNIEEKEPSSTIDDHINKNSCSTSPKALTHSQSNNVLKPLVHHHHDSIISQNPPLKKFDSDPPCVDNKIPRRKPLSEIKSFPLVGALENANYSSDGIAQVEATTCNSNALQLDSTPMDLTSTSSNTKINMKNAQGHEVLESNLVPTNEEEIKQPALTKTVGPLTSSSIEKLPLQNPLLSKNDNVTFNVENLVANGLEVLGQNGFNVGNNLQQLPSNDTKEFIVNGNVYKRIKCIGKGGSCKVFEVVGTDGHVYALKRVKLEDLDAFMIDSYLNEIKWLEKLRGDQHIIKLYGWEQTKDYLLLVIELGEKDLAAILRSNTSMSTNMLKIYWKQMLNAVQVIHRVGIIHADLKPANFLFVGSMLKLIDFGIANGIQGNKTSVTREYQMGTLNYMPPEALMVDNKYADGNTRISRASDVWSLGCMLYLMVYKKTPYQHIRNQSAKMMAIQRGQPIDYNNVKDPFLLDCLQGCLRHDKRERYTIEQLLAHDFLKS